ncbi:unnamed protein product [Spirodela intermedia]|uniref:Uncharacterized protein n=1 Tax=Spirodela intermedia TaxID=51605 RepID=A0A7I8IH08_SPIIN|nr:unnamed protein product [Spirodela intermedia]CAA6656777.1 unnamed protein product [Spirodela intermedia]
MVTTGDLYLTVACLVVAAAAGRGWSQQLPGTWELLVQDAGIASMHSAVTRFGTVVLLDRTDIGPRAASSRRPAAGSTPPTASSPNSTATPTPSTSTPPLAKSVPSRSRPTPGAPPARGRYKPILPDGSIIIVGGRAANSVEFYPPRPGSPRPFPFLADAGDAQMDNLYPYVHLLPDGNLFVFANTRAVLYDHVSGEVLREYPQLEGGPRNFPSAGSSAMLALSGDFSTAEVVVCGGAEFGVFIQRSPDTPAHGTCGRIVATAPGAAWSLETMPFARIMGDMVMLPTGEVLIINGAQSGAQGFDLATDPCLNPVLYRPAEPEGLRFMTLTPTDVPRMYHSTANLLPDGRVLVAGSNPHHFYKFQGPFRRSSAWRPSHRSTSPGPGQPAPVILSVPEKVCYGEAFQVEVTVELPVVGILEVNLASAPFSTHSFSMGQRLVKLNVSPPASSPDSVVHRYSIACTAPPSGAVAPPGFYMAFVVNQGVPSVACWIQIIHKEVE